MDSQKVKQEAENSSSDCKGVVIIYHSQKVRRKTRINKAEASEYAAVGSTLLPMNLDSRCCPTLHGHLSVWTAYAVQCALITSPGQQTFTIGSKIRFCCLHFMTWSCTAQQHVKCSDLCSVSTPNCSEAKLS